MTPEAAAVRAEAFMDIQGRADKDKEEIDAYIKQVFEGGDVHKLPSGDSWYHNSLTEYAKNIVNAYRRSIGQPENPYAPWDHSRYRLFDVLLAKISEPIPWVPASKLSGMVMGSRVETYLDRMVLRRHGYDLEKELLHGKVHFRLVEWEESQDAA